VCARNALNRKRCEQRTSAESATRSRSLKLNRCNVAASLAEISNRFPVQWLIGLLVFGPKASGVREAE
jgi:hypothetical protein